MNGKITIITVTYNAKDVLEKTILSVIGQTYPNIEYIIIDGGSTDGTIELIKKYENHIAYWISEPDNGIYDAMNKGTIKASGQWVNFMNAGDFFYTNTVLYDVFSDKSYNSDDVIYGDTAMVLDVGNFIAKPEDIDYMIINMAFCHQASFTPRTLLLENMFDCSYKICADYNLFYTLYKKNVMFKYVPITIVWYEGENGISSINEKRKLQEVASINRLKKLYWRNYITYLRRRMTHFLLPKSFRSNARKTRLLKRDNFKLIANSDYSV